MRKAITPVISIVLLTLMTVGVAVLGFVWINNVQSNVQESAGTSISDAPGGENTRLQIISVRGDGITVQNVGSSELTNVTVLINGELTSYDLENPLSPGDAVLIPFTENLDSDTDYTFTIATNTGTTTSVTVDDSEATSEAGYTEGSGGTEGVFYDVCAENSVIVDWDNKLTFDLGDTITCGCNSTTGANLVLNPGFEDGLNNWETLENGNVIIINDTHPHSGSNSLYLKVREDEGLLVKQSTTNLEYINFFVNGSNNVSSPGFIGMAANFTKSGSEEEGKKIIYYFLYWHEGYASLCDSIVSGNPDIYVKCISGIEEYEWNEITVFPELDVQEHHGINLEDYSYKNFIFIINGFNSALFDDVTVSSSAFGEYCEVDNSEGIADGICLADTCVPLLVNNLAVSPSHIFRTNTVSFTANFYNITPIDHCTLSINPDYSMDINSNNATYSNVFMAGEYEASVECEDTGTNTDSSSTNFTVTNWNSSVLITYNGSTDYQGQKIGVEGDNVFALYLNGVGGDYCVLYKNSSDNGVTWSNENNLTCDTSNIYLTDPFMEGSNLCFVISNYSAGNELDFYNSSNGGVDWSRQTITPDVGLNYNPSFDASGDNVHVLYYESSKGELNYTKSSDAGVTWIEPITFYSSTSNVYSDVSVNGDDVHVIYYDSSGINNHYYVNSSDGGVTWNTPIEFFTMGSGPATIDVEGDYVHVAWQYANDIYYRNSTDGGITWNDAAEFYSDLSVDNNPEVEAEGSNVYIVWKVDIINGIKFSKSSDNGATWTHEDLDFIPGKLPNIATSSDDVHMIWKTTGDIYDLYYSHYDPS